MERRRATCAPHAPGSGSRSGWCSSRSSPPPERSPRPPAVGSRPRRSCRATSATSTSGRTSTGHKVDIDTKGDSDLYVVSNVIAPGGHTGWHTHPGPSLITVKSGTITAYEGDDPNCNPTVYTAGQGFVDPGDGHVHLLRNEGTVPAETIAVQLVPDGGSRRIDEPAPDGCPL